MAKTASGPILQLIRQALDDPGLKTCPDDELLQRFLMDRDEAAFEAILRRHGPMVLDVCRSAVPNETDAEDAFQATFLVLARNGSSIRGKDSLGGWLHGVARRTALKAKAEFARRRKHEGRVSSPEGTARDDPPWSEVRRVMHEELAQLSERHRVPLVLCYLQGQTQDQAAAALNMSKGTLKRRVERGRALLRQRLLKRGLGLGAMLLASAWPEASASVPPTLLRATGQLFASGAHAAAISPSVLALAKGGIPSMTATPWKLVTAAALVLGLAGAGLLLNLPASEKPPADPPPAVPDAKSAPTDRHGDPLPAGAVVRLGTERFRSDSWLSQVTVVPGGKQILGLGSRGVHLWNAATGKEIRRFEATTWRKGNDGATYFVRIMAFAVSPDGKTLAAGTTDRSREVCPILMFDLANGEKIAEWPGHQGGDNGWTHSALAFVSSTLLVTAGEDKTVRVWDVAAKKEVRRLETPGNTSVSVLAASPDGKHVVATGVENESGWWTMWDSTTGKVVYREVSLPGHFVKPALSPDGLSLAISVGVGEAQKDGGFNEVRLYSTQDWKEQRRWKTHTGRFPQRNSVAFAPDAKTLTTGGADQQVRRWDVATAKEIGSAITPYKYANNVTYLDADTLITFDAQHALKFWDATTGKPKFDFGGAEAHLTALGYSPDGRHVAVGGGGGDATVRVWEVATGRQVAHLKGGMSDVTCLKFSPDGQVIATADSSGVARLWDWNAGSEIRAFKDHKPWLQCVAFSPEGKQLATGDEAGVVRVWDVAGGQLVHTLRGHSSQVSALAFTSDGRAIVSGGWDHCIRHWDLTTGKEIRVLKGVPNPPDGEKPLGHTGPVTALTLSPGGQWLYSASYDHTICVWEMSSGRFCRLLKGQDRTEGSSVSSIALSADGTRLAAAIGDIKVAASVHVWDVLTGEKIAAWPGHRGKVTQVAFSPDGRRLASCSFDTTAMVWDVAGLAGNQAVPDDKAIATLWEDLGAGDPETAYAAVCRGAAAGDKAVAVLKTKLKPVAAVDAEKVADWVKMLDSSVFADRERASQALADLGPGAEPVLRKMIAKTESAEVRSRLERILDGFSASHSQSARTIEVMEMIGTREAKLALTEWAKGATDATLTREAAAALRRIEKRK